MNTKYNGWTNFATWKINLELLDNVSLGDFWGYEDTDPSEIDSYEFSLSLKDYAEEYLYENCNDTMIAGFAQAFLSEVNWLEIAEHIIEANKE